MTILKDTNSLPNARKTRGTKYQCFVFLMFACNQSKEETLGPIILSIIHIFISPPAPTTYVNHLQGGK